MDAPSQNSAANQQLQSPTSADGPWIPDGILMAGAVLLAVALMSAIAIGWDRFADTRELNLSSPLNTSQADEPGNEDADNDATEVLACPEGTDPAICDAAAYVQRSRQRPFKVFPQVELLEADEFVEALLIDYDENPEDIEHAEVAFKALGLIQDEANLFDEFREVLTINVVGFYDSETDRLVVRGSDLNLYTQSVLVHELVHAFDDQWFDLDRDFADDEAEFGFIAVVEGNATRIDEAWTAELSSADRAQLLLEQASIFSAEDLQRLRSLPSAVLELQLAPYQSGSTYLGSVASEESEIDALLETPPETSERVLHPQTSEADDPQIEVPPPAVSVDPIDQGKLGEVVLRQLLGVEAAQGWDGDAYVVWNEDDRACIAVNVVVESSDDLTQLASALDRWVAADPERSSEQALFDETPGLSFSNC